MNTDKFDLFYQELRPKLVYKAYTYLNNWSDAEDIVQDVFVNIWELRDKINASNIKGYIYRAVIYESMITVTHQKVQRERFKNYINIQEVIQEPSKKMENDELKVLLINAIEYLNPNAKRDFVCIYLKGAKQREIAAKYNISLQVIKNRMPNTLHKLKIKLKNAL